VSNAISQDYRRLLSAGLAEDREDVMTAAIEAGFVNPRALDRHPEAMRKAVDIAVTQMARPEPLDFGDRAFVPEIRETVMPIAQDRDSWHLPPAETLFVQRKISGTALLGARLKARVDVRGIVQRILDQ